MYRELLLPELMSISGYIEDGAAKETNHSADLRGSAVECSLFD
jgi:hypothetical protein